MSDDPYERLARELIPTGRFGGPAPTAPGPTAPSLAALHVAELEAALDAHDADLRAARTQRRHLTPVLDAA